MGINYPAIFSSLNSANRYNSTNTNTTKTRPSLNYEVVTLDIVSAHQIESIADEVKEFMFGKNQREVNYSIYSYNTFSIIHLPLASCPKKEGSVYDRTSKVDQLTFAALMIIKLEPYMINITDTIFKNQSEES